MQTTIYYSEKDAYLMSQVDMKGRHERKSRSAVILSILEKHFEREKRLGEILIDLGAVSHANLARGLELQKTKFADKLLGEILLEEELGAQDALEQALTIQGRSGEREGASGR
ncbi:MAG: hypothetical protein NT125_05445 [Candidatus Bipolaricaulota bacterium]|nr:hypothetical protein [Candidatus Bipolaricaulota bacterium]